MLTIKAALAGALVYTAATTAALAEPKTNLLSQWSEGSDAAAIAKLGEMFTAAGGKWEQTSIAGHTANTLAKLRADVVAGNAPPAVQLKGPEIAEWNETGKTANLDAMANEEGWDKVVAPDLLPVIAKNQFLIFGSKVPDYGGFHIFRGRELQQFVQVLRRH